MDNLKSRGIKAFFWDFFGKIIVKNLYFQKNILLYLQEVDNGTYIIKVSDSENYYLPYKLIVD